MVARQPLNRFAACLRLLLVLSAALLGEAGSANVVHADAYTYDALQLALVEVPTTSERASSHVSAPSAGWVERSSAVARSSTTAPDSFVATEDFTVYRFGKDSLTLDRLTTDAASAAGAGLPYGFSVSDRLPPNRAGDSLSARVSDLNRAEFCVEQTGSKKNHYTVHLDQPLTQAQVDLLNGLFT